MTIKFLRRFLYVKKILKYGLCTIDSDMRYISIVPDQYSILGVHCTLKRNDKAQESYVMNLSKDQLVTVYGKITDVGEVLGYSMDVDKFE